MCTLVHVCTDTWLCVRQYTRVYLCTCVPGVVMRVHFSTNVCPRVYVDTRVYCVVMCTSVYVCSVHVCTSTCVWYVPMYVHVCRHVCVHVCPGVWLCVYVNTCVCRVHMCVWFGPLYVTCTDIHVHMCPVHRSSPSPRTGVETYMYGHLCEDIHIGLQDSGTWRLRGRLRQRPTSRVGSGRVPQDHCKIVLPLPGSN